MHWSLQRSSTLKNWSTLMTYKSTRVLTTNNSVCSNLKCCERKKLLRRNFYIRPIVCIDFLRVVLLSCLKLYPNMKHINWPMYSRRKIAIEQLKKKCNKVKQRTFLWEAFWKRFSCCQDICKWNMVEILKTFSPSFLQSVLSFTHC